MLNLIFPFSQLVLVSSPARIPFENRNRKMVSVAFLPKRHANAENMEMEHLRFTIRFGIFEFSSRRGVVGPVCSDEGFAIRRTRHTYDGLARRRRLRIQLKRGRPHGRV